MTFRCTIVLVTCLPSWLLAQTSAARPCQRPTPKQFAAGTIVTITETRQFPCTVSFYETGVELRADAKARVPDIMQSVARDSRGRYYTGTGSGQVVVWTPAGKVLRTLGRNGNGPGEFQQGSMWLSVDPADNLYVRDNHARWAVFSPDYKFLRQENASYMAYRPEYATFTGPLTMLSSLPPANGSARFFGIFDFSGKSTAPPGSTPPLLRTLVDVPANEQSPQPRSDRSRLVNTPAGGEFWAGPPDAAGRGYELQLWSLDGTLKRTIRRTVPWFTPGSDLRPILMQHEDVEVSQAPMPKPLTGLIAVRYDGHGLLFVATRVVSNRWNAAKMPRGIGPEAMDAYFAAMDIYFEVIDADAGIVLASSGPIQANRALATQGWFSRGWSGYRMAEGDEGLPIVKMVEVRLNGGNRP